MLPIQREMRLSNQLFFHNHLGYIELLNYNSHTDTHLSEKRHLKIQACSSEFDSRSERVVIFLLSILTFVLMLSAD